MLPYLVDGHPLESWVSQRNRARQYDFMNTAFVVWSTQGRPELSLQFIRELNYYAAHLLSPHPGEFRDRFKFNVDINGTDHTPPPYEEVDGHMQNFIVRLRHLYASEEPLVAAAYALWRLNWIHPFAQGNGRTSRALCSFVVNQGYNLWFPGTPLVELIRNNRDEYCLLLSEADKTLDPTHMADLEPIILFLERLLIAEAEDVKVRMNK